MDNIITISLIIATEIAVLQTLGIIIFMARRKKKSNSKQAQVLCENILADNNRRQKAIETLTNIYDYTLAELDQNPEILNTFMENENNLYQTLVQAISSNNPETIQKIASESHPFILQHIALAQSLKEKQQLKSSEINGLNHKLQEDVEKLRSELKATLETMEQTLSEYANKNSVKANGETEDQDYQTLKSAVDDAKKRADSTLDKLNESINNTIPTAAQDDNSMSGIANNDTNSISKEDADEVIKNAAVDKQTAADDTLATNEKAKEDSMDLGFEKINETEVNKKDQSLSKDQAENDSSEIDIDAQTNSTEQIKQDKKADSSVLEDDILDLDQQLTTESDTELEVELNDLESDSEALNDLDNENIDKLLEEQSQKSVKQA